MSHIAIDARIINSSTGRYVERLLHYLEKIDTTNTYSILVPSKDVSYWKPTNPNFHIVAADFASYSFEEQLGFKVFIEKLNPDVTHFCMPQQPILFSGLHVTTVHDLTLLKTYSSDKNWLVYHAKQLVGWFVFQWVARTSQHIITPTTYVKNDLIKLTKIPADKITVTYEAGERVSPSSAPYNVPFESFILYVGNQSDYKNIKRLGDAHQELLKTHPNLGLVLAGKKNAVALKNEAYFTQKQYSNIHFTDFIPDDQLSWLYEHCAAYIFPSLSEGFGLPGLEAMSHGAAVVSSKATCLPEVYGDAAWYFDPRDTEDVAKKIAEVLDSEQLHTSLIEKGREKAAEYSWQKMAEQTHEIYVKSLETQSEK